MKISSFGLASVSVLCDMARRSCQLWLSDVSVKAPLEGIKTPVVAKAAGQESPKSPALALNSQST